MKKHCDVCGKRHFDIRLDERIKEVTGLDVYVCLDCYAWWDDNDRYNKLLENGIIDDDMFDALVEGGV